MNYYKKLKLIALALYLQVYGAVCLAANGEYSLFDTSEIDDGVSVFTDNLLLPALIIGGLSALWGIFMLLSIFDNKRWYLPIAGILIAIFLADGFTAGSAWLTARYAA